MVLNSTTTIAAYIKEGAIARGIEPSLPLAIAECESSLNSKAVGDKGTSLGVYQIHLPAHPDIQIDQALDPKWNIDWSLDNMQKGKYHMWSCYRIVIGEV